MTIASGTRLGRYDIRSQLGAGAMGEVYLAQDTILGRRVALKILPREFAADADRMRRFVLEAKSASALNHPNIITIYEIGETDETNFIATEYIEGQTLNSRGSLALTEALDVASQIASALQAAHSAGIIHRDIKPENVIIRPDGLVKVLDFGIAKQSGPAVVASGLASGTDPEAATAVKGGTSAGVIIGTASYMSPEQARGRAIDARSDIFSFGVVLYEMLAGRKPFTGENAMDVIGSIVADEPTRLTELLPSLPPEIDRLVCKTLKKKREDRYQTIKEVLVDLKGIQKRLEFEAELERTGTPDKDVEPPTQFIRAEPTDKARADSKNSIAVMPFANMSNDAENEYFCDGLAEELLNALAKIDDLKVAARTSSFSFKGRNENVSAIGRALSVNTVLEGSVRRFGDHVRITVQLINAADGYHLWSERYDREMRDIFDVQDEITLAVVDALKVQLLGEEKEALLKRYTNNAEAYQFYLRGRFFFCKRTPEGFRKAMAYFEEAIQLDPAYALAHSGLADCYTFLGFYELVKPSEALEKVRSAAYESVELDGNLAETRTSVALFKILYEWSFQGSLVEFEEAIRINPKYALAHHLHSASLVVLNLNHEAIAAESRAAELEPFTAIFSASLGWWHYLGHRFEEAIAQSLKTIEIAPNHFFAHWVLGITYGKTARYEEAVEALRNAASLTDGNQHINADLARIYAQMGREDEARRILDDLIAQSADHYISAVNLAKVFVGLRDKERVLEYLEKAYEERAVRLPYFLPDPCVDDLRSDPRFQSIRRRVGLPEEKSHRATNQALEENTALFQSTQSNIDDENSARRQTQPPSTTGSSQAETTNSTLAPSSRMSRRNVLLFSLVLFLLAGIGLSGYWFFGTRATRQIESIAVMPFVNESGNADVEYLSDGMTETLISSLSQLPNLNVKARSTVFRYKGRTADARTIGKELNVQAILNGRVVQRGDQLTLSLELVDVATENAIWSQQYSRKQTDLVTLQSEIARDVSSKLKSKLSGADVAKVEKTYTANTEAYQLYLKGKFYWNKRTGESLKQAAELYQQAIEKDLNYALAYSGLAETYVLFSSYDVAPATDSMPQAKAAALRALAIDDSLAEAHTALGFYLANYEWDRGGSEKEYRRAIELNPNYSTAHHWLGADLGNVKRFDDSLVELKRAEELDPLSPIIGTNLADMLVFARRYDEAIAQYKRILVRNPNFEYAHLALGRAYGAKGMYPEAIAETRTALELNNGSSTKGYLGLWLARSGKRDEALKLLSELKQEATRDYVQGYTFAVIYIGLSDKEEALHWLEKHMSSRAETANTYAVAPELDDLRSEPRFKEMLKRMNLPE